MGVGYSKPPGPAGHRANHAEAPGRSNGELPRPGPGVAAQPDWLLWQLADSAFPTGGFAHSSGLEAAWHHGELRTPSDLENFVQTSLRQFGHGSLPFMTSTHADPARLIEVDLLCESFTLNHVANRASRAQGRALLASAERIFHLPRLQALRRANRPQPPCCHLAPVFGVITRSLDLDCPTACRLFLFLHLRGLLASAVRLGIVGPFEAQALQHTLGARAEAVLHACQKLSLDEIAQVSPLLELWQATHDRLYSRLFQS
jgi:urease accessory protein